MAASIKLLWRASPQTSAMPSPCVSSLSTPFSLKSLPNPSLSLQSKPIKFRLSLGLSSFTTHLSLIPLQRRNLLSWTVSCVSETSNWAQQEGQGGELNTTAVQGLEQTPDHKEESSWEEDQGLSTPEASLSDWEASGGEVDTVEGEDGDEGGEFPEPPEDAKLFVGNLPYDVDSERLAQLFEPAGIVEIAEVIYNRETDQSRGFGFVTMSTVEEAEKACEMFNRYDVNGRLLTVNKAAPRGSRPERPAREAGGASFTVYVGNIPWDVDSGRLEEVFSEFGRVVNANVVLDRETGRSRGFGFVTMSSESEMNDAIRALDGQTLDGRIMRVNVAQERPRRNF